MFSQHLIGIGIIRPVTVSRIPSSPSPAIITSHTIPLRTSSCHCRPLSTTSTSASLSSPTSTSTATPFPSSSSSSFNRWATPTPSATAASPPPLPPTPTPTPTPLTPSQYAEYSNHVLEIVQDRLEAADMEETGRCEVDSTDGVLKWSISDVGTWVLNTHRVTQQLWLSSPISGPHKFTHYPSPSPSPSPCSSSSSSFSGNWRSDRDYNLTLMSCIVKEIARALTMTERQITFKHTF